jgi:hypothetical protein
MPQTQCRLIWYSSGRHLQQLYTGFLMLRRRGLVRLSQGFSKEPLSSSTANHLRDVSGAHLSVVVNGDIRVHYDCHDAVELSEQQLERCEFYFKRSYSQKYVDNLPKHKSKVFPLGLYYRVLPDSVDFCSIQRAFITSRDLTGKLLSLVDALDAGNWLKYSARVRELESLPDYDLPPKVLFLAAAHDPYANPGRSKEKIEGMVAINDTRAKCIQVLRQALGPKFFGGFIHSSYSIRAYKQSLVHDNDVTRKRNYIRLLKSFPICIATTGLHGSIGGKFAEYVALAKAIVSEKLNYEVPGDLQAGRHYLEFGSPEECAEKSMRLIEDREEREKLMFNNALYYQSYLRPDALVLNSLLKVLSTSYGRSNRSPAYLLGHAPAAGRPAANTAARPT